MTRHGIGQPERNEVNRAFLLPVRQTIGRKTDIFVRIEKLQVVYQAGHSVVENKSKTLRFGKTPLLVLGFRSCTSIQRNFARG